MSFNTVYLKQAEGELLVSTLAEQASFSDAGAKLYETMVGARREDEVVYSIRQDREDGSMFARSGGWPELAVAEQVLSESPEMFNHFAPGYITRQTTVRYEKVSYMVEERV